MVHTMELLVEKGVPDCRSHCLNPCFLLHVSALSLWHLPLKMVTSTLVTSLPEQSGHIAKEGAYHIVKTGHEGWKVGRGHGEATTLVDPGAGSCPPPLSLECASSIPCSQKLPPKHSLELVMWS